uniref:Ig-like domain-containing protein n=1 Tax=Catagonus wagneri TaxID=51154 RepID=A0A8C3VWT4_9CETA
MKRLVGPVLGLLLARVCCVRGVDVKQSPPALSLQEGASSTLWCNFSEAIQNVYWYRQSREGRLVHLFSIPSGTKRNGRLNATTVLKERRSSLHISSAQTTDSATYLCAAEHSAPQAPAACTGTLRGTQFLLQPQSQPRAATGHSHCSLSLTNTGTGLTTDTFCPFRFGTFLFIFPSQSVSPSALESLLARRVASKKTEIK